MVQRIDRLNRSGLVAVGIRDRDRIDPIHLMGVRPTHIRHDTIVHLRMVQANRLGQLFEQIHDGCAAEPEMLRTDRGGLAWDLFQADQEIQPGAHRSDAGLLEPGDIDKEKLLWKREVLMQQAVPELGLRGIGQHALVRLKSHGLNPVRREHDVPELARIFPTDPAHAQPFDLVEQRFIEGIGNLALTLEIEAQRIQLQFLKRAPSGAVQLKPQHRLHLLAPQRDIFRLDAGCGNFDRPERHGIGRAKSALHSVDRPREQLRVAGNGIAGCDLPLLRIQDELRDRHGRNGSQVMGIENPEQRVGDFWKLIVELPLHSGREKGDRLDEPLDMRVLALAGFEQQPPRHLWVGLAELLAERAQIGQLPLVVGQ